MKQLPVQTISYLQHMLDTELCTCGTSFCYKCNASYCLLELQDMLITIEQHFGTLIAYAWGYSQSDN